MKRYVLLLLAAFLSVAFQAKKAAPRVPEWVQTMTKGSVTVPTNRDFSSVISYNLSDFIGYIGRNYYKMDIRFRRVRKVTDVQYSISGSSKVRNITCPFDGTLKIIDTRVFTNPGYGVDDEMKGKFDKRGCSVARFELKEERMFFGGMPCSFGTRERTARCMLTISTAIVMAIATISIRAHGQAIARIT